MGRVRWSRIGAAVVVLLGIGACATREPGGSAASAAAGCPPVRGYSDEFRKRAVAELDLLPANSAVEEMLTDYAVLRQQIRACQP
jgi:hypothetical protein